MMHWFSDFFSKYDKGLQNAGWFIGQAQENEKEMGYMYMKGKHALWKIYQVIST